MNAKSGGELLLPQPPVKNEKIKSPRIGVRMCMAREAPSDAIATRARELQPQRGGRPGGAVHCSANPSGLSFNDNFGSERHIRKLPMDLARARLIQRQIQKADIVCR